MPPLDIAQSSCGRCRKRRVKCDRRKPGSQRCEKYSQPCPGYEKERLFRDEGPGLHRKFASTRSSKPHSDATSASTQATPGPVVFSDPTGPSTTNVESDIISSSTSTTIPQESVFEDARFFDLDPAVYYDQESDICDASAQLPQPAPASVYETDHELQRDVLPYDQPAAPTGTRCNSSPDLDEQNHKQDTLHALLIRRFVEFISPWLDVFETNWSFEAASFYDKAIRSMITGLKSMAPIPSDTPPTGSVFNKEDVGDLLAAMPILLVYELLDNHHLSIVQHLAGAHHLLSIVLGQQEEAGAVNETIEDIFCNANVEDAWKAAFWNFATFDYFTSYAKFSKTRFGFASAKFWQASGLSLTQVDGRLVPVSLTRHPRPSSSKMTETVACRTLLWIVLKILDCIASDDQSPAGEQP
ncbi:Zn(2)-C6 fungal-type domain-containing protein [Fusarium sp. Ph1]|nr:Zn(2)-C6 fungal-type domain-containing protein [Fusarium sp. Ph1]